MKIGINLWNWTEHFSNESIVLFKKVKEMGYDVVEFGLDDLDFDPELIKKAAEDNDLAITLCACMRPGRDISNEDANIRQNTIEYLRRCLDFGGRMGAKSIGGAVYAGGGRARILPLEKRRAEWDLAVAGLRGLAPYAFDNDIKICIEPLNRYKTDMVNSASQACQMVRDIGESCYGVLFDTYQASIEEKNIPEAIRNTGRDYLAHFHASENDRGCPGTGQIDWVGTVRALRHIKYEGYIVVESFCESSRDNVWRATEETQDVLAKKANAFLRALLWDNLFDVE